MYNNIVGAYKLCITLSLQFIVTSIGGHACCWRGSKCCRWRSSGSPYLL